MDDFQSYKVAAVDVKQVSLDLVKSYDLKPNVSILAMKPVNSTMEKITAAIDSMNTGLLRGWLQEDDVLVPCKSKNITTSKCPNVQTLNIGFWLSPTSQVCLFVFCV